MAEFHTSLRAKPETSPWSWLAGRGPGHHPRRRLRDGRQALELAQEADQRLGHRDPTVLDALAAAYAETGRFPEAVQTATAAHGLATATGDPGLAAELEHRIELYRQAKPVRQQAAVEQRPLMTRRKEPKRRQGGADQRLLAARRSAKPASQRLGEPGRCR